MLHYTSILKLDYINELEQLMFFNPGQQTALAAIVDSVERFGSPSVYVDGENLRIKVEKIADVQTLYALDDDALVGVLVYSRVSLEKLTIIHIVVDPNYSSHGKFAEHMLVMQMLKLLRKTASNIKGIKSIKIMFSDNQTRYFSV